MFQKDHIEELAVAIALTTTALGTLLPILIALKMSKYSSDLDFGERVGVSLYCTDPPAHF